VAVFVGSFRIEKKEEEEKKQVRTYGNVEDAREQTQKLRIVPKIKLQNVITQKFHILLTFLFHCLYLVFNFMLMLSSSFVNKS